MIQPERSWRHHAFLLNAVVAWLGVAMTTTISALGWFDDYPQEVGLYGDRGSGLAGAAYRVLDTFSYFTIWSNVAVALALTLLVVRGQVASFARRVLHHDAVLMITVTAIVYAVLLAPGTTLTGWSRLTNPTLHIVTPALTVLVWLVAGPRGWLSGRTAAAALGLPVAWIGWMLLRGALDGTYPYAFLNLQKYSLAQVAPTLGGILVFGILVAVIYWAVDRLLTRPARGGRAARGH